MPSDPKQPHQTSVQEENISTENHYLKSVHSFLENIGSVTLFTWRFFKEVIKPPYEFKECIRQSYNIGYKSLMLVVITGFIMGLVLTLQSRPTLAQFGAESWIPAMVSVSMVREIGPVITALLFAGKAGSGIGAELASMKVTEQIDAMEGSGINPFKYIVVTRVVSATLMLPILVFFADAVSLYGAYIGVNINGDISLDLFTLQVFDQLSFTDVFPATVKTVFFGFAVGLIACYKGYYANSGTEGVGAAANSAVVSGSLAIFIIDMIAVQLTTLLY
jgi:phospholipid/cholesterol/gamma-HCH transport system permease protein